MSPTIIGREQARALGLKLFFDGKPCRRGHHVAQKHVDRGHCVECRREKAIRNKPKDREAYRAYQRAWYASNPEKVRRYRVKKLANDVYKDGRRVYGRAYAKTHTEERKAYRAAHREHLNACSRERRRLNPEQQKAYRRKWLSKDANLQKQRQACANWAAANPDQVRLLAHKKRARRRGAPGKSTVDDITAIFQAQKGRCAYCRRKLKGRRWHVDHKISLAKGGTNHRHNLQICCKSCNLRKHAKDPIDFAREMGLLL